MTALHRLDTFTCYNDGMKKMIITILLICVGIGFGAFAINAYVALVAKPSVIVESKYDSITDEEVAALKTIDPQCILILGCAVWDNNEPSPMLRDRLDTGIELYKKGVAPKILISGDNSIEEYSEPDCMLKYCLDAGAPIEDIFMDFAGVSTYDSIYRASDIFEVKRMVVVSQRFHLFRSLNGCRALGIDAMGVGSNQVTYKSSYYYEGREVLARVKDFFKWIVKPESTVRGDKIPITGPANAEEMGIIE